jgi:hypothetical protein
MKPRKHIHKNFINKKRGVSGHESQKIKKKSKSRFTEITTKIEDWKLKFTIFENFTNQIGFALKQVVPVSY